MGARRYLRHVSSYPIPYVLFPGTAREALAFYHNVFGGKVQVFSRGEMSGTSDESVGHGELNGTVHIFGADASGNEAPVRSEGLMLALLGVAEPDTLRQWFAALAEGGEVLDDLQKRPWGDWDGQVRDAYGLTWLIGFKG